jgi:hypothetical protein
MAIGKDLQKNLKEIFSMSTLKDGAILASGSLASPMVSALIQDGLNKITKKETIKPTGAVSKVVDLLSGALLATVAGMVTKSANVSKLMLLGAISGVMSDVANETITPKLGLSDYVDPRLLRDYLQLPQKNGMRDYLKLPNGMRDFATVDQIKASNRRMNDFATVDQVVDSTTMNSADEEF